MKCTFSPRLQWIEKLSTLPSQLHFLINSDTASSSQLKVILICFIPIKKSQNTISQMPNMNWRRHTSMVMPANRLCSKSNGRKIRRQNVSCYMLWQRNSKKPMARSMYVGQNSIVLYLCVKIVQSQRYYVLFRINFTEKHFCSNIYSYKQIFQNKSYPITSAKTLINCDSSLVSRLVKVSQHNKSWINKLTFAFTILVRQMHLSPERNY